MVLGNPLFYLLQGDIYPPFQAYLAFMVKGNGGGGGTVQGFGSVGVLGCHLAEP